MAAPVRVRPILVVASLVAATVALATVPYQLVAGLHGAQGAAPAGLDVVAGLTADGIAVLIVYLLSTQLLVAGGFTQAKRRFGRSHRVISLAVLALVGAHAGLALVHVLAEPLDTLSVTTVGAGAVVATAFVALLGVGTRVLRPPNVRLHLSLSTAVVLLLVAHAGLGIAHSVGA